MRIVYQGADGLLKIVAPVAKGQIEAVLGPLTDEAYMAHVLERSVPAGTPHHMVDEAAIPATRDFRNAWVLNGKAVAVDMPKARDIHRDRLRALRAPLFAGLDIEYQRADEAGDKVAKSEIAAKKKALRDVTVDPAIEAAKTPDELISVIPLSLT